MPALRPAVLLLSLLASIGCGAGGGGSVAATPSEPSEPSEPTAPGPSASVAVIIESIGVSGTLDGAGTVQLRGERDGTVRTVQKVRASAGTFTLELPCTTAGLGLDEATGWTCALTITTAAPGGALGGAMTQQVLITDH